MLLRHYRKENEDIFKLLKEVLFYCLGLTSIVFTN